MEVKAVEETADTIYLVLPSASPPNGELSDRELEAVSGGDDAGVGSPDTWSYC